MKSLTESKMATSSFRSCSRYLPDAIRKGHLPSTDYYPALRQGFRSCWQERWTSDHRGAKLRNIKPNIGEWSSSHRRKRLHEMILARLRIDHTNIIHSHYMSLDPFPIYKFCRHHTPQSGRHIY